MSEAGVHFDAQRLLSLHEHCTRRVERCIRLSDMPLRGEGSEKGLRALIGNCIEDYSSIKEHPAFAFTKILHYPKIDRINRLLVAHHIPPDDPRQRQLRLVDRHQRARDLVSRYTGKLPKFMENGIIYPSWFVTPSPFKDGQGDEGGTQQGRITCTNPPLQTLPAIVKRCMSSRYPGGVLLSFDLSQIEMCVAAILSGDPYLIDVYQSNRDLHTELAIEVQGEQILVDPHFGSGDNEKDPRQTAKVCRFASLYGAGWIEVGRQLIRKLGLVVDRLELQDILDRIHQRQSVWYAWGNRLLKETARTGYVEIPFTGQRRYLDAYRDGIPNKAVINYPVQCTAANVLLRIQEVWRRLPRDCKMVLNVYDSIVFDCCSPCNAAKVRLALADTVAEVADTGYWAMICNHYGHSVPLKYEIKETT